MSHAKVQVTSEGKSDVPARVKRRAASPAHRAATTALIEFVVVSATAYLASFLYHELIYQNPPATGQYVMASVLLASFHVLICFIDDQYHLAGEKWRQRGVTRGVGAIALAFVFLLAFSFVFKVAEGYSRGTFLSQLLFVIPALLSTRIILAERLKRAFRAGLYQGRGLVVLSFAGGSPDAQLGQRICEAPDKILEWHNLDLDQLGHVGDKLGGAIAGKLSTIHAKCRRLHVDGVVIIFDAVNLERVARIVEAFYALPAVIQLVPLSMIPFMQNSRIARNGQLNILELLSRPSLLVGHFLKRSFDLVAASAAVVVLSPLLLLVSLAIKLDSRGPILFRQMRHGFNNEPIDVMKFRTMATGKEAMPFRQATKNDPRVTRLGRLLRRTNIDELPQLFNVISGEMSLVGPRPHAVEHNEAFAGQIKMMARRHNMKPGITGWAQVNGFRGETDTYEKMTNRIECDLYYIDNWSFIFDIKILFMTLLSKTAYTNAI